MIVDPDLCEQAQLEKLLGGLYPTAAVYTFVDPLMAIKFGAGNPVNALYVPVVMQRLGGFELGKLLRDMQPGVSLNFIGDSQREEIDAMRVMADSYIFRPVTEEKLRKAEKSQW